MASLNGQTIASSYEQLLHTDTDGGGNGNTLVTIKDGDNGTVFGLKLATNKVEVIPSAADDANAFEVSQNDGTAVFTVDTSTPSATFTSDVFIAENIKHTGDTDTRIRMLNDNVIIYAGNENQVDIGNAITVFNEGGGDNDLRIESSGNANMFYVDAGNNRVGIGTASPAGELEITAGDGQVSNGVFLSNNRNTNNNEFIYFRKANSTSVPSDGWTLGEVGFQAWDGDEYHTAARIDSRVEGTISNNAPKGNFIFLTADGSDPNPSERMRITSGGKVGIGTTSPSEVLQVNHSASDGDSGILIVNESTSIANDTFLGGIGFDSADGNIPSTVGEASAAIVARSAEAHGTGDKGGNLLFLTSAIDDDDDTGSHERMRITSEGNVGIGDTSPSTALSHFGSASRGLAISNQQPTISFTDTDVTKRAHIAFEGTNRNFYISSPESDGIITFHTGGYNERMRILSGGGITFNGDTATANALDDYEEGTITPVLHNESGGSSPTQVYDSRGGFYTKIGNRVFFSIRIEMNGSGVSSGSGNISIGGLPFTVRNDANNYGAVSVGYTFGWLTGQHGAPTSGFFSINSTNIFLRVYDNDAGNVDGSVYADGADVTNGTTITVSGHYIV
jgi:hypothetical protein